MHNNEVISVNKLEYSYKYNQKGKLSLFYHCVINFLRKWLMYLWTEVSKLVVLNVSSLIKSYAFSLPL